MNRDLEAWEGQLRQLTRSFPYPATPPVAQQVRHRAGAGRRAPLGLRQPAWIIALILFAVAALMAVPPVRAAVVEFIQLGAIRIFNLPSTPSPGVQPSEEAGAPAPGSTWQPPPVWADFSGRTTLERAQELAGFPLAVPAYPPDLGLPEKVYYQDLGGPAVILLWLADDGSEEVELALFALGPGVVLGKTAPELVDETLVAGSRALWLEGDHLLFLERRGVRDLVTLIQDSNVLVWETEGITYRLQGKFTRQEAARIAESLAVP